MNFSCLKTYRIDIELKKGFEGKNFPIYPSDDHATP
jgi:hypothetical protein